MNLKNFKIFIILSFSLFLYSCVSTKTLKYTIDNNIPQNNNKIEFLKTNYLTLEADSLLSADNETSVKRKSSYLIPLIVYWTWKSTSECTLTNRYFVNLFNEVLIKKNNDFPYEKYIQPRKLIIELTSVPNTFYFTNRGSYIVMPQFLGVGIYFTYEDIYPKNQKLSIKYKLISENDVIKQGEKYIDFNYPNSSTLDPSDLGLENYLDNLKKEFEFQSSLMIDKVIDDL